MEMKVPTLEIYGKNISATQEASFWSLVKMDILKNPFCWEWTGQTQGGYGRFKIGKSRYNANRISYAIAYGCTPADKFVCHICDNPLCVRPDHLFLGTATENALDRMQKNRTAKGSDAGGAILKENQVIKILKDTRFQSVIAKEYGVSKSTIGKIKSGKNWLHVRNI